MILRFKNLFCLALVAVVCVVLLATTSGYAADMSGESEVGSEDGGAALFSVPRDQSLAGLAGVSEIPVAADAEGLFVDNVSVSRYLDSEPASPVDAADLTESINIGRGFNRESLAAAARTEQAAAQTGQAVGDLLPSVSVRANRGYEISEPSVVVDDVTGELKDHSRHIRTDVTLTVSQPLFDLPTFLEWRRRKQKEKARGEGYRVSDGDAYLATVKSYLSLVSTRLQSELMRDFEAQLAELLSYIEKRAGAGAASVADMSRVRARSQETVSTRLEQESAHLAAGTEFVRLTNLVPQKLQLPALEDVGLPLLPETYEQAVEIAMESNPEITTLMAELQSEKINKWAARGRFLPQFDAEYTDTYSERAGGSDQDQRDKRTMLVLNWNLFRGGKDIKIVRERVARYEETQYRLDDQRRRVVQALASNYSALKTTGQRLETGYQELESIATAAEAMSKRMLSGNQSLLDLLTVYDRYYKIRGRLIDLHVFEMNTVAQLVRLTVGTPWPAEKPVSEGESNQGEQVMPLSNEWDSLYGG